MTPTEPPVVERAVRRRDSGISMSWILATGPIATTYNIGSLGLASVRPTGLIPSPGPVQFQSISTDSEHDAPASGRAESLSVTLLVYTLGGGPIANTHVVYIRSITLMHLCWHV